MANTYGLTPADVAAELPGLYPGGFSAGTVPTATKVQEWLDTADLRVTIRVQDVAGLLPISSDRVAPLAKRAILDKVIAQVLRAVYTGNAPSDIADATRPYEESARAQLDDIAYLGAQAAGAGTPVVRIRTSQDALGSFTADRDLIIQNEDLNPGAAGHGAGRFGHRRTGQF